MNVILLCDKTVLELFALQGELPVAQLPVLDKTIAEYHLELVCNQLKPSRITLVAGHYLNTLKTLLGNGCRWGVELDYTSFLTADQPLPALVLPCDRLSGIDAAEFVSKVAETPELSAVGWAEGIPAIYWIAQRHDWRELISGTELAIERSLPLAGAKSCPIESMRDFYQANLDLVRGLLPRLNISAYRADEQLLLASRAEVGASVVRQGKVYVGANSRIGKQAQLFGDCVIQQQVLVDDHAVLENSVIMPHSYVGSWVAVKNALVSGSYLWRMDTGVCLKIKERFLLNSLHQNKASAGFFDTARRWSNNRG